MSTTLSNQEARAAFEASPFSTPFDQWGALQMMAENLTSRDLALMRRAWFAALEWQRCQSAGADSQEKEGR
jgi:hypothetical protein